MNKMMPILMAVIALVVGAGGTFLFLKNSNAGAAEPKKLPTFNLPLDERTINLADVGSPHYLKVTIVLEVAGEVAGGHGEGGDAFEEIKPLLMDRMIDVIGKQTYKHLLMPDGKKHLREELHKAFGEALEEKEFTVEEVLFTDFLME